MTAQSEALMFAHILPEGPWLRCRPSPKGWNGIAQGNALGLASDTRKALKGRNTPLAATIPPLQG